MSASKIPPKVFISYSWDDASHKNWVREFAARLRGDGLDVTLDQWHVRPGDQLPAFMEQAVRNSDFVLIVCTPIYKAKSEGRAGGVGYEGTVIQGEIFIHGNDRKFIPLLRRGRWIDSAPTPLSGKAYIAFNEEADHHQSYRALLHTLYSNEAPPPAIGQKPDFSRPVSPVILNRDLRGHEQSVERVAITQDGSRLVSIDQGGQLRVWDSVTGTCLRVLSTGNSVHQLLWLDQSGSRALALGTQRYPRRVSIYSLDSEQPTVTLEDDEIKYCKVGLADNYVGAVAAALDWRIAITGSGSGELSIWDLTMAVKIRAVQAYNAEERKVDSDYSKLEGGVCSIRILRDGTKAVTLSNRQNYHGGRYDSAIKVWDLRDGSLLKGIPPPGDRKTLSYSTWEKENDFTSMCITSDESTIATTSTLHNAHLAMSLKNR